MILGDQVALILLGFFGIAGGLFGLLAGWGASRMRGVRYSQPVSNVLIGVIGVYLANWLGLWLGHLIALPAIGTLVVLIAIWRVPESHPQATR